MSAGLSLNMWARYARVLPRETCVAPHGAPSFAPRMYRRLLHAQPRLYPNELNTRAQTLLAHTNASTIAKFSSCHMQKSFFATVPHMHPRVNNDCVIMNGKATATKILEEIRTKVDVLKQKYNQVPGLAVICVGSREDSLKYVRKKEECASRLGFHSITHRLPDTASQADMVSLLDSLNADARIHGILVQLPLPSHISQKDVINKIGIQKDVDGFHAFNVGSLALKQAGDYAPWEKRSGLLEDTALTALKLAGSSGGAADSVPVSELVQAWDFDKDGVVSRSDLNSVVAAAVEEALRITAGNVPCTPRACMTLLRRYNVPLRGRHAVVLGRSNIVGLPVTLMLMHEDATVTNCHVLTPNVPSILRTADIVIAAIGVPRAIRGSWIKPGAAVIDVGINITPEGKIVGDIHFDEVRKVAGFLTPVPGGVGPMTVAMLMENTLSNFELAMHFSAVNGTPSSDKPS